MELKSRLENDLKDALRAGDEIRKTTIRMTLAAIKLNQVEKGAAPDEAGVTTIIQKEIKSRKESIADAEKANRKDLIDTLLLEIKILETYLPEQMNQDDLLNLVQNAIDETGAVAMTDMGKVMKVVLPQVQGRAPNDQVSAVVRMLLQKNQ
jgi:uncharacterized protein YqeY